MTNYFCVHVQRSLMWILRKRIEKSTVFIFYAFWSRMKCCWISFSYILITSFCGVNLHHSLYFFPSQSMVVFLSFKLEIDFWCLQVHFVPSWTSMRNFSFSTFWSWCFQRLFAAQTLCSTVSINKFLILFDRNLFSVNSGLLLNYFLVRFISITLFDTSFRSRTFS